MARLLLVSNRLPVSLRETPEGRELVRSSGGLVAGLGPAHDRSKGLWIGQLGLEPDPTLKPQLEAMRLIHVHADADDLRRHYEGYSNGVLWPLFHYLLETVEFDLRDFEAYERVNRAFADAIVEVYEPGDAIWVHDYHLMLLPKLLRERLPDAAIAFFLHIPFPSSEVFRILPRNGRILEGLLGANLIGVHTYDYGRHLVSSCSRVLGVDFDDDWSLVDGASRVGVFPLGIDATTFRDLAESPAVAERSHQLWKDTGDRTIILGVDRMDYTKGIPLRLRAFARLLERREDLRGKVTLIQLCVPSRGGLESYRALKEEVDRLVGAINGEFGGAGYSPINYLYRSVSPEELVAMYVAADIMLVTPIRDGMNLVAKEYVASRIDDSGVLILSEFAGAAAEMGEATLFNPWDIEEGATAIEEAIGVDAEDAKARMAAMRQRVMQHDVHAWVERYLEALDRQASARVETEATGWQEPLARAMNSGGRSLLMLDYDGTLVELKESPELAAPTADLIELLVALADHDRIDVVVSSGRDTDTLESWLGDLPITLIGEHGLRWRMERGQPWEDLAPRLDLSWMRHVREILEEYMLRLPGSFVEQKNATLVWHYRKAEAGFGQWLARELASHLRESMSNAPVEVSQGHKIVEVRPQGIGKGAALRSYLERRGPYDRAVVIGDDRTDEDMFAVRAPGAISIKVGRGTTVADHSLKNPGEVRAWLRRIAHR